MTRSDLARQLYLAAMDRRWYTTVKGDERRPHDYKAALACHRRDLQTARWIRHTFDVRLPS